MISAPPLRFTWEGDAMKPAAPYYQKQADKYFVIGETYIMVEHRERSQKSHSHYFAAVNDAWGNLPDHMLAEYPSAEHLRKKALIRKGYCDERSIVCSSKADALRIASFLKPMDEYAIVIASEAVVKVLTAQSQSRKAMGPATFQESKTAVLEFIDEILGTARGETERNAGRAA